MHSVFLKCILIYHLPTVFTVENFLGIHQTSKYGGLGDRYLKVFTMLSQYFAPILPLPLHFLGDQMNYQKGQNNA